VNGPTEVFNGTCKGRRRGTSGERGPSDIGPCGYERKKVERRKRNGEGEEELHGKVQGRRLNINLTETQQGEAVGGGELECQMEKEGDREESFS